MKKNIIPILPSSECCKFRIPADGGRVLWQVTNVCNYQCAYCIFGSGPQKAEAELSYEHIVNSFQSLWDRGFRYIKFTGGEPFLRRDMVGILREACSIGFRVDVSTNASRITSDIAEELARLSLDMVHVSLDGHTAALHESVRGTATFERTLRGLRALLANNLFVRVGVVVFRENEISLREIVDFCARLGVAEVIFSRMEAAGRMKGDSSRVTSLSDNTLAVLLDTLTEEYSQRILLSHHFHGSSSDCSQGTCPGGKEFLFIDERGHLSPCSWISDRSHEFRTRKTLRDCSLTDLLDSSPMRCFREMLHEQRRLGYAGCPVR